MTTKKQLEDAFNNYVEVGEEAVPDLYQVVFNFCKDTIQQKINSRPELIDDADDYAQIITIAAWKKLPTFRGEAKDFYSWVNRLCYLKTIDAHRKSKEAEEERVSFLVTSNEDSNLTEDNPELYQIGGTVSRRSLPPFISGKNKLICDLIREGMTYKEIAEYLSVTEGSIKKRVEYMRKKVGEVNA